MNAAKEDSVGMGDCIVGSGGKLYLVEQLKIDLLKLSCDRGDANMPGRGRDEWDSFFELGGGLLLRCFLLCEMMLTGCRVGRGYWPTDYNSGGLA